MFKSQFDYHHAATITNNLMRNMGGGTFRNDGTRLDLRRGYAVGGWYPPLTLDPEDTFKEQWNEVFLWALTHIDSGWRGHWGTWTDESDGTVFLDLVDVFEDRDRALIYARQNGERAIYDFANGIEVRVP